MYGVYINCSKVKFLNHIIFGFKHYETRTRDMLHALIGKRVALIETGRGKPTILATAIIKSSTVVRYEDIAMRDAAKIRGTDYDIKPGKTKVFYELADVHAVAPRPVPKKHINHGRSYTEF